MNKLNILTFIEEYNAAENKEKVLKKLEIKTYAPLLLKKVAIDAVLDSLLEVENGLYTYNPLDKHLYFVLAVISTYTNLEYEEGEAYQSYDALMEKNFIDTIINSIGYDYADFVRLFEEALKIRIQENNSIPNIVNNFLINLSDSIANFNIEDIKSNIAKELKKLK